MAFKDDKGGGIRKQKDDEKEQRKEDVKGPCYAVFCN